MTRAGTIHLRPVRFVDTPIGQPDGAVRRLNGGLLWFAAVEARHPDGASDLVPVAMLDDWLSRLSEEAQVAASQQLAALARVHPALTLGERIIRLDTPQVMGILNVTPDSFSDGGALGGDVDRAVEAGFALSSAGASIIDVGGESTRPGAQPVWEGDEIKRVVPVIERLAKGGVVVSVDTRKAAVMEAALAAGAHIVNDVSGLCHDPRSMAVVSAAGCPVIIMHAAGQGDDPHGGRTDYGAGGSQAADIGVFDWLQHRIDVCMAAGIRRENIIVDPGIGFGKPLADDLAILNRLGRFHALGQPLLIGASRKRLIGALSREESAQHRLGGSIAIATIAAGQGAQIVRAHDVRDTAQALNVWRGLRDAALSGR